MAENKKKYEIDVIGVFLMLLKKWRFLLRFFIGGALVGVFIAFSTYKSYKSEVILAPEFSSGGGGLSGSLSELAESFGVNLSGGSKAMDAIYPELYPDIISSTDFISSLYDVPVRLEKDATSRSFLHHITIEYKLTWWQYPKVWISRLLESKEGSNGGNDNGAVDPYRMNRKQWEYYKAVNNAISCLVDKKTNVISITVIDQDPMVAAIMADTIQQRLQTYITDYRTKKARVDVCHYQDLVDAARTEYELSRNQFVRFSDANQNVNLMSVNSKIEDLENDMKLKYSVYTQAMSQLKLAEARLQERTPAFTIVQPAKTIAKPVSTPKIVIMVIWIFLSMMIGCAYVLHKEYKKDNLKDLCS